MPRALDPDIAPLVGSWRLQSFRFIVSDANEYVEPYGPNPNGRMVLIPAGRIVFLMMNSDRRPAANDTQRAVLFNRMTAYTGMVRSDGPGWARMGPDDLSRQLMFLLTQRLAENN